MVAPGVAVVPAAHFLQEYDVGAEQVQLLAQLVDREPPVEQWRDRESLVDVVGRYAKREHCISGEQ